MLKRYGWPDAKLPPANVLAAEAGVTVGSFYTWKSRLGNAEGCVLVAMGTQKFRALKYYAKEVNDPEWREQNRKASRECHAKMRATSP